MYLMMMMMMMMMKAIQTALTAAQLSSGWDVCYRAEPSEWVPPVIYAQMSERLHADATTSAIQMQ